jgi:2Fe-2S ferredoxin
MPQIAIITRDGQQTHLDADSALSLMENLRQADVGELSALCGGCCSCATCHVYVLAGQAQLNPLNDEENDMLDSTMLRQHNSRLACQIILNEDSSQLVVQIAPEE